METPQGFARRILTVAVNDQVVDLVLELVRAGVTLDALLAVSQNQ